MGYNTEFTGHINIEPALSAQEIEFIKNHSETRRMLRAKGAYYISTAGDFGQVREEDIINYNNRQSRSLAFGANGRAAMTACALNGMVGENFIKLPSGCNG